MRIRPLQDRIIVKRSHQSDKTEGGIFSPDTAREKPFEGTVVDETVIEGTFIDGGSVIDEPTPAPDVIDSGEGPTKVMPWAAQISAKPSFSARNP